MIEILVEYQAGEKRTAIEVDPFESVEFFRYQLYSLTGIPPAKQQILGLANSGLVLTDSMQIKQLSLAPGQRLIVKERLTKDAPLPTTTTTQNKAPTPVTPASSASAAAAGASTSAASASAATPARVGSTVMPSIGLDSCCSRSFFGDDALVQPSALAGDTPICYACAQTCHMARDLKPRPSLAPFVCGCSAMENRECIFGVRAKAAADLVAGPVAAQIRAGFAQAATQMQEAQLSAGKAQMQARIGSHIRAVLEYENPEWQARAREVTPVATLEERAAAAISSGASTRAPRDELLEQLLIWFKNEFFRWENAPLCETCNAGTQNIGGTGPNAAEAPFRPGVVELYRCPAGHVTRFPRYNHAAKLLETRRGRCGEYAQAFTLICRALGFEARSANDWTDHVWTEVYSDALGRWVHCDSCEARRDAPMLYSEGWGKKLTYIIACSKDEVVDVTQRYTRRWSEVLERRTACPENWLNIYISSLRAMKLLALPAPRQAELTARRRVEEAEFAANVAEEIEAKRVAAAAAVAAAEAKTAEERAAADALAQAAAAAHPAVKDEEKQGRTTGSVEWRSARGELGADAVAVARALNPDQCAPSSSAASSSSFSGAAGKSAESVQLCSTQAPTKAMEALALNANNAAAATAPADSSSTSAPAAAAAASTSGAAAIAAAKARTAALFRSYTQQLTTGCGAEGACSNEHCKSNPAFFPPQLPADIAKAALELTKKGPAQLCSRLRAPAHGPSA